MVVGMRDNCSKTRGVVKNILDQGYGIYYYNNGDIFVGEWLDDKFNGSGHYLFANGILFEYVGERYSGVLSEGLKHGHGKYYYLNGNTYEGDW
jgi:hypothetical protein